MRVPADFAASFACGAASVAGLLACGLGLWLGCASPRHGAASVRPGDVAVRRVEAPTVAIEREALAKVRSVRVDRVQLALAVPDALDRTVEHPILITQVTAGRFRPNVEELEAYAPAALAEGYVVLTAQTMPWPEADERDTLMLRYVALRAGLRWLENELPESGRWPIVLAGFSGGAKISQALAFSLMLEQRRVAGVFLGGCNEDHSAILLGKYPTLREPFSRLAFYLSVGEDDRIAPPAAVRAVGDGLRRSGAGRVEVSVHRGGHQLDPQDLAEALRWFRAQLGPASASSAAAR